MTPPARFTVERVFDLPQRGGLLAQGRMLAGVISPGTVLQDDQTGARTTVLGIEMVAPSDRSTGQVTLILERTVPSPVISGRVLTGVT